MRTAQVERNTFSKPYLRVHMNGLKGRWYAGVCRQTDRQADRQTDMCFFLQLFGITASSSLSNIVCVFNLKVSKYTCMYTWYVEAIYQRVDAEANQDIEKAVLSSSTGC